MLQESKAFYVKSEHMQDKKLEHTSHFRSSQMVPHRTKSHHRTSSLDQWSVMPQNSILRSRSQSPPPLPPKPSNRRRSKTGENHGKKQAKCDVQMQLRHLLSYTSIDKESPRRERSDLRSNNAFKHHVPYKISLDVDHDAEDMDAKTVSSMFNKT
jgi:hypothetical protein